MLKIFKLIVSCALIAGIVVGGIFVYRSCSMDGCDVSDKLSYETPVLRASTTKTNEGYTGVLEDLQADENFTLDKYPEIANDYSLQVIQIAEDSAKHLLLYVYQPSGNSKPLTATTVRISTAINDNAKWQDYSVTLVSQAGTLQKYVVNELTVKSDVVRYYDIVAFHRKWDKDIDDGIEDDNTISEVFCEVAQLWTACTLNGNVTYELDGSAIELVRILDKHVGFLRYPDGYIFGGGASVDGHYVAFSTDHDIDRLMEADLTFVTRHAKSYNDVRTDYDSPISKEVFLNDIDEAETNSIGIFGHTYKWKRIESISSFMQSEESKLTNETKDAIQDAQWVFRFYESEYKKYTPSTSMGPVVGSYVKEFTEVSDVTILRLMFETSGTVYNLGVVDNKQSGDNNPDNKVVGGCEDFFARIWNFVCEHWNLVLLISVILIAVILGIKILTLVWGK